MAEAYRGLVGAFGFALRRSESWILRSYVVAATAVGVFVALLLLLGLASWAANPVAFGERAFLLLVGLLVVLPLFAPVLVVARRHRLGLRPPASADRWLGLAGYAFVAALVLGLYVSDPTTHAATGLLGPVVRRLDALPDVAGLVPPVAAAVAVAVVVRLTRPG